VLERLVADRRISPGEIYRYLSDINREISSLEERLNALRGAAGGGAPAPAPRGRRRGRRPGRPPGRPPGRRPGRPPGGGGVQAAVAPVAVPTKKRRGRPPGGGKKRRGAALTPEQLASRQLQGRYLGLIRQIPATRRGQYQKIAKERGREAAIREMQDVLKK
jgi:hypothetical protein